MATHLKPIVYVSKCLGFAQCRFNGLSISSEVVKKLQPHVEFNAVCPELEIGLGVPRNPIRLVSANNQFRLIQLITDKDVTDDMQNFTRTFFNAIDEIDGWILRSRSPSCGFTDVRFYPHTGKVSALGKSAGLFGGKVTETYSHLAVEDEGRLNNFRIREHFLTKLYTLRNFRSLKSSNKMKELVRFHSQNKLLLMAYNQKELRTLGRIVANPEKRALPQVMHHYEEHLLAAFRRPARFTSNINVLMHTLGYFSKRLSHQEKAFFLDSLEQYRAGKIPLSVPSHLIKSWTIRFEETYLMQQTFFEPYPEELMEITDSGKGRNL